MIPCKGPVPSLPLPCSASFAASSHMLWPKNIMEERVTQLNLNNTCILLLHFRSSSYVHSSSPYSSPSLTSRPSIPRPALFCLFASLPHDWLFSSYRCCSLSCCGTGVTKATFPTQRSRNTWHCYSRCTDSRPRIHRVYPEMRGN